MFTLGTENWGKKLKPFCLFLLSLGWCWANAKDIPTLADWCCYWQDEDTFPLFLSPPRLWEAGREEEGRRGKSQDALDSADAAQFRRMEGVRGLSRGEKPSRNVWKTGPGGVLLWIFFIFPIGFVRHLTRCRVFKSCGHFISSTHLPQLCVSFCYVCECGQRLLQRSGLWG